MVVVRLCGLLGLLQLVLTTAIWRVDEWPSAGDTVGIIGGDANDVGCVLLV